MRKTAALNYFNNGDFVKKMIVKKKEDELKRKIAAAKAAREASNER